jgi:hypothetical protein
MTRIRATLDMSEKDLENYQKLKSLLVVESETIENWLSVALESKLKEVSENVKSKIVDAAELKRVSLKKFGKNLTRDDLKKLRQTIWTEGLEYFGVVKGKMRMFRYDLAKCLAGIEDFRNRELRKKEKMCDWDISEIMGIEE